MTSSVLLKNCRVASWCSGVFRQSPIRLTSTLGVPVPDNNLVAPKEEVIRFISDCIHKVGATQEDAHVVAHHLMTADYRGHFSHGMNRMPMYVADIECKLTDPRVAPVLIKDFQAVGLVDGQNGLGQVIGKFCMELAIEKAKKHGISMIAARGCNHYGICGYYTLMAAEKGLIGFSCTNTSPLMVPTRANKPALGTNPLSLAMKSDSDEFVLDMATTAVALGKIELASRKEQDIPHGWALDRDGNSTTDAQVAVENAKLMPLGGSEENSGYKGYGLAVMVEMLCGILTGSQFGPNIRNWTQDHREADLGQCFMAIDPNAFAEGSQARMDHLLKQLRNLPHAGKESVMVAGDPERKAMAKVNTQGGIHYHANQIKCCNDTAKRLQVRPINLVEKKL